jgi:hypothetical protein
MQRVLDKEETKSSGRKREHFKCTCCFRWNELVGRLFVLHLLFFHLLFYRDGSDQVRTPDESLLPETVDTRFLYHSFCCGGIGRTPPSFLRPTLFFPRIRVLLPLFLVETERKENNHSTIYTYRLSRPQVSLSLLLLPT